MSDIQYPINYNFKANWDKLVIPHLDNLKLQKQIQKGVNSYLKACDSKKRYIKNTIPASYTTSDGYFMYLDELKDDYIDTIVDNYKLNKLNLHISLLEKNIYKCNDIFDDEDELEDELERLYTEVIELEQTLFDTYYTYENFKYKFESYVLLHACHWYNSTAVFQLAKLVKPNIKWIIRRGRKHTTVMSRDMKHCFDLQYFMIDGDTDFTMGGKLAYLNSLNSFNDEE